MKIAYGAAQGLEYLHDKANPPVIYRDLKSSNILLDEEFNPKLSDFGLAKLGPMGDKLHVSSRVMGTYGYCAPEYARTGHLTVKSDVYSFGVVLLELITGRRAIDTTKQTHEQNLVTWVCIMNSWALRISPPSYEFESLLILNIVVSTYKSLHSSWHFRITLDHHSLISVPWTRFNFINYCCSNLVPRIISTYW